MSHRISLLVLCTLALLMGGCWRFPTFGAGRGGTSAGPSYGSGGPYVSESLTLSNGSQAGDMGDIRAFAGSVTRYDGYYDSYGANIRLDSEGDGWWTMSSIHITGDLAGDAFAPGTRRTYTSATYDASSNVSVTGCSGPTYGSYTYDAGATEVTIEVQDLGGGERRMIFETIYTTYDGVEQVTSGTVDYVVPDSGV